MTDDLLTDELAARVMGWRLAPGRYIKAGRSLSAWVREVARPVGSKRRG